MQDFTQRGTFEPTAWRQTGAPPNKTEWELWGISLAGDGTGVLLGRAATLADCLVQAQAKLAAEYPGRFI